MPVRKQAWAPGTPAWVDVTAADLEATKAFYSGLFGWEYDQAGEDYGSYATALLDGEPVAGIGPSPGPDAPPPSWTTYLAVADAEKTEAEAVEAGGKVLLSTLAVGPMGSMAVLADPGGAVFGLWQAGEHTGFNRYNEPGADVWNEVVAEDYAAGQEFYAKVFGYTYDEMGDDDTGPYATAAVDGNTVGGIRTLGADDSGLTPQWRTYFSVADTEATCRRTVELGGSVTIEPFDTPFGAMAGLRAPGGEAFMVIGASATPPADG